MSLRVSLEQARLAWIAAQGLGAGKASLMSAIERTGFLRTLGGVEAYLAAAARVPGLRAKDVDAALASSDLQVLPAVRGCMYLVPRASASSALRLAGELSRERAEKECAKAGVKPAELDALGKQVVAALKKDGPLSTDALRKRIEVRSLGEAGKKLGLSSPLPPALRRLEWDGKIERRTETGRLDTERYVWRIPTNAAAAPPRDVRAAIAETFVRAAGYADPRELAGWMGVSLRDANAALATLDTVPVEIDGVGPHVALRAEVARLEKGAATARAAVALLPFEDNLVALHGGPRWLVDAAHHDRPAPTWGNTKGATFGDAKHISARTIVAEGRIVGIWEWDPDANDVVLGLLDPVSKETRQAIDRAAASTRELLREIGHGRSFSLDDEDELRARTAFVRANSSSAPTSAGRGRTATSRAPSARPSRPAPSSRR